MHFEFRQQGVEQALLTLVLLLMLASSSGLARN